MVEQEEQGFPIFGTIAVIILIGMGVGAYYLVNSMIDDYQEYKTYQNFCEDRPTFCYCSFHSMGCEFKTSWSSQSGFSNETKELCDLAIKIKDKETIFQVGCNE